MNEQISIPHGKTIMITGAGSGIGRAIAERFGEDADNTLLLFDRCSEAAERWLADNTVKAKLHCYEVDITDRPALYELQQELSREFEGADILVNCAGIADENDPEDIDTWTKLIDVNLNGTFYFTSTFIPFIRTGGRIINMSSVLGKAGKIRNTAYCASKHGIIGMTKALAIDLAQRKITVNAILPAWVDTPMLREELKKQANLLGTQPQQVERNARRKIPLRQLVLADEVAGMVNYLTCEEAKNITAQSFTIDGGSTYGM